MKDKIIINIEWEKRIHPGWWDEKKGRMAGIKCPLSKNQWVCKTTEPNFSILGPCYATYEMYELYDQEDTYRFDTLDEAKEKALEILNSLS